MKISMQQLFFAGLLGLVLVLPTLAAAEITAGHQAYIKGDFVTALKEFKADGSAEAFYKIGIIYDNGLGVDEDKDQALSYYRKAAEMGLDLAQHRLGEMYDNGRGVDEDMQEAAKWYLKSAEQGLAIAQYKLGRMYLLGLGIEKNLPKAIEWLKQSAVMGNMKGQVEVATMYESGVDMDGINIPPDQVAAAKWYLRAAAQGHTRAQYAIGRKYLSGDGVPQDKQQGVRWLRKAAQNGHGKAQMDLGQLESAE